ncbi:GGDEF domain-containing protein [Psychromonas sp. SP041]|uniref:GGDEF domain-containing protein n=1 Tax=Psychromonas sp. SP041 TaxID=1365007 RepID=UPI0010C7CF19|nr:GGDEF domain-containing protein [Psychromonas sp. SP041]
MPRLRHRLSLRVVTLTIMLAIMTAIVGVSGILSLKEFQEDYGKVKDNNFEMLLNMTMLKVQSNEVLTATTDMFLAENESDLRRFNLYIKDRAAWIDQLSEELANRVDNAQELFLLKSRLYEQVKDISDGMFKKIALSEALLIEYKKVETYKRLQMKGGNSEIALMADNVMSLFNSMDQKSLLSQEKPTIEKVKQFILPLKNTISEQEYNQLSTLFLDTPSLTSTYQRYLVQLEVLNVLKSENAQLSQLVTSVTGEAILAAQKSFLNNLNKVEEKITVRKSHLYLLLFASFIITLMLVLLQIGFLRRVHLIRKIIDAGDAKNQFQIPVSGRDEISEMAKSVKKYIQEILEKEQQVTETNKKLEHLAMHDGLTNIYNRRYFDANLEQEHLRYLRYKEPYCLAMLDLDLFKSINDTYGHDIGDKVLIDFTSRVSKQLRETDLFARLGGEEFGLLMPRTSESSALILMERIRGHINSMPCIADDFHIDFSVSIGLVEVQNIDDMHDVLKQLTLADKALYDAKKTGRNRVCVYQGEPLITHQIA